tara:strand:+ start:227 stop:1192 length:966 start_codon:yes stop_codon:yes gene_type:complete
MHTIDKKIEQSFKTIESVKNIISENFFGQKQVVDEVLSCVLCSDHALIEGVPGLGKTLLFQLLSNYLNLKSNRIQCTPDLMPSDILGTEILNNNKEGFSFIKGPIFCQLLMIDEVNRASPRTQSAFLQAMEENEISISGKNFSLPKPFLVLATQNPIEQEGTYNLPEAQLDRFLMKIKINYPNEETEKQIYSSKTSGNKQNNKGINTKDLIDIISIIDQIPIGKSVSDFVMRLVRNLRPESSKFDYIKKYIQWGPGPRGGLALLNVIKARALIKKKLSPTVSDIINFAQPTLRHRISLNFEARADLIKIDQMIKKVCEDLD